MPQNRPRFRPSSVIPSAIALVLAMGWATREMANASTALPPWDRRPSTSTR